MSNKKRGVLLPFHSPDGSNIFFPWLMIPEAWHTISISIFPKTFPEKLQNLIFTFHFNLTCSSMKVIPCRNFLSICCFNYLYLTYGLCERSMSFLLALNLKWIYMKRNNRGSVWKYEKINEAFSSSSVNKVLNHL